MERKKRPLFLYIVLIALVVTVVIQSSKISDLNNRISSLDNNLNNNISRVHNQINEIYDNVDTKLKQQVSLISGFSYDYGELDVESNKVAINVSVVPKLVRDDITLSLTLCGETFACERNGNEFSATVMADLFSMTNDGPLLTIESSDGIQTEYLTGVSTTYLFDKYLPNFFAYDMWNGAEYKDGNLILDTEFFVDWYIDDDYNSDILFNSISRIVEVDGREVDHIDLRDAISSEEKEYNGTVIVKDEYELSEGETLTIYVQAEDYLGYIHKLNVMEFTVSNGEIHQSTDTPGKMIYDQAGNLLYSTLY